MLLHVKQIVLIFNKTYNPSYTLSIDLKYYFLNYIYMGSISLPLLRTEIYLTGFDNYTHNMNILLVLITHPCKPIKC